MYLNQSELRRYQSREYNPSRFWIPWWKILWRDNGLILPHLSRLMENRSIKYPGLRIAEYIRISFSIWYGGLDMTLWRGNLRSLWMAYTQWTSSTNDISRSQNYSRMFWEDLEPRRGILSRLEGVRRYLGIMKGIWGRCGRNCVTERKRCWETQRIR